MFDNEEIYIQSTSGKDRIRKSDICRTYSSESIDGGDRPTYFLRLFLKGIKNEVLWEFDSEEERQKILDEIWI